MPPEMSTTPINLDASINPPPTPSIGVGVSEDVFGVVGDATVKRYTLTNRNQMTVQVISLGAIITSIQVPSKQGKVEDVVLGFDGPKGYLGQDNPYFGAIVGRVANRIANASFSLDGKLYQLNANRGRNTLHGGLQGWDKALWEAYVSNDSVTFTHQSPDGDEGFPGTVTAQVTYRLTSDNRLFINMQAVTSKPTPINVVNHAYFNLAGHCSGPEGVYDTHLSVNADRYTVTDQDHIPTGDIANVVATSYDLRAPRLLGEILPKFDFDINFVINHDTNLPNDMVFVASAYHVPSGRSMEVYSNQPGVQLYTSGGLPGPGNKPVNGKSGAQYVKHAAFCLETQNFPDAIHNEGRFPNSVLRPGGTYKHNMILKFGTLA